MRVVREARSGVSIDYTISNLVDGIYILFLHLSGVHPVRDNDVLPTVIVVWALVLTRDIW